MSNGTFVDLKQHSPNTCNGGNSNKQNEASGTSILSSCDSSRSIFLCTRIAKMKIPTVKNIRPIQLLELLFCLILTLKSSIFLHFMMNILRKMKKCFVELLSWLFYYLIHRKILKIHKLNILILSWRKTLSYRKQPIDLRSKSMDWFLYDTGLRHERVKHCRFYPLKS